MNEVLGCQTRSGDLSPRRPSSLQLCNPAVWVDNYGDCLFRYAMSYVRDTQIAEDLVQETFLAALVSQNGFLGGSSEQTWLIGILKHKVIDYYRAMRRQNTVTRFSEAFNDDAADTGDTESCAERARADAPLEEWRIDPGICTQQKAFWSVFQECLSKLSPRLASAFSLKEIEQLDTREICAHLNVTEGNLWVMLHRARTYLRECLEVNWLNKSA
jgi:RNA polymerase sigma-70 factor (ECF subfamily)